MDDSTSEAPRSSIDTSVDDMADLLDQIRIEFEKEESIEAAGTSLQGRTSQPLSPASGSSNETHQLDSGPDYGQRTGLNNPLFYQTPLYPTRIQTDFNLSNGDFGVSGSIPFLASVSQNMPSLDMPSTSYSARQNDPFSEFSSWPSWAYQNGGNNSAIWRVEDNLMRTNLSMNNDFAIESPQFDEFEATWGGRNYLMQENYSGIASGSPQTAQFAAAERDEPFSVCERNRCLHNQRSYDNGGQDGIPFEQVDMVQMAMTAHGSKQLQDMLAHKNERTTNMIFEKTLPGMLLIMNDKCGHFLFARLIDNCNPIQLFMIVEKITSRTEGLLETSCHSFGSQCIKSLIRVLERSPLMIAEVTSALSCIFYDLMTNKTGSFAILKCFEVFTSQQNEVLYRKLVAKCIDLAIHEVGCVSLNRSIQYIKGQLRYQLLHRISEEAVFLSHDPFGNFTIQSVIGLGNPAITSTICSMLKGHYVELSKNIGGSHVVEKCLRSRCPQMIFAVQDLLNYEKLGHVAKNQYGNYVIQSALRETKRIGSPLHEELLSKILSLRGLNHGYGKKVVNYIQRGCLLNDH